MNNKGLFVLIVLLAAGCTSLGGAMGEISQLTPYSTKTPPVRTQDTVPTPTPVAVTPVPTATPRIHIVALTDTISSIALQYGVTIDAILKANPDVESTLMIVGDEILIPGGETAIQSDPDPALVDNLHFDGMNCMVSGGGLWCGALLRNMSGVDLEFPVAVFTFMDGNGENIETINVPAVMRKLPAGGEIPVVVFLEDLPAGYAGARVDLLSVDYAAAVSSGKNIQVEGSSISLDGLAGTISGNLVVETDDGSAKIDLTLAAAALDADGELVGVRRVDSSAAVDESVPFKIVVYSSGRDIADIILFAEAY